MRNSIRPADSWRSRAAASFARTVIGASFAVAVLTLYVNSAASPGYRSAHAATALAAPAVTKRARENLIGPQPPVRRFSNRHDAVLRDRDGAVRARKRACSRREEKRWT